MAAGTGFLNRFKGKQSYPVGGIWIGGTQLTPSGLDLNTLAGSGTAQTITTGSTINGPGGVTSISATTAIAVYPMTGGPVAGVEKTIVITSVSSGIQIKAPAGASFDPSTNTVIKSTYAMTIKLMGLSTTKYTIQSVAPPSTAGVAVNFGITLSTTT